MISVKQTDLYSDVLKELNYSFGDVFIFEGFIVSEIKQGINFSWNNHAKQIVDDVSCFLGTDKTLISYSSFSNSLADGFEICTFRLTSFMVVDTMKKKRSIKA